METKSWIKTLGYILIYTIIYIILVRLLKLEFSPSGYSIGLSAYAIYLGFCAIWKTEEKDKSEEERSSPPPLGISASDARLLMGGRNNEVLEEIYNKIQIEARAGKESITTSIDPFDCNIGYIGESLENHGFVVEVDGSIPGPLFYLIISWTKK